MVTAAPASHADDRRRPQIPAPRPPPEHAARVGGHRRSPEDGGVQQHEAETDRQAPDAERVQGKMDDVDVRPPDNLPQEAFVHGHGGARERASHRVRQRDAIVAKRARVVPQPQTRAWARDAPPHQRLATESHQPCRSQSRPQHVGG